MLKSRLPQGGIPPLDHCATPVDVNLRIRRDESQFQMEISALELGINWTKAAIPLKISDLERINKQLQEYMQLMARDNTKEGQSNILETEKELAKYGYYTLKKIFKNYEVAGFPKILMSADEQIKINIVTEDFHLAWELLYPFGPEKPYAPENFWGMKHIISRSIQPKPVSSGVRPSIYFKTAPKLGLMTDDSLYSVGDKVIPFFDKLKSDGRINLFRLQPLDVEEPVEGMREFKNFWRDNFQLAHFACHAYYQDGDPEKSYISLTKEFAISLVDLEVYNFSMDNYPLVIMNACQTGNLNPRYTWNFASTFFDYGARGVVATECTVPDDFAADFTQQLYPRLLAGEELGASLLATRRFFLKEFRNPTGLLYSLYAPPSIRLVREK